MSLALFFWILMLLALLLGGLRVARERAPTWSVNALLFLLLLVLGWAVFGPPLRV